MELDLHPPKEFQKTEYGQIPVEWKLEKISDFAVISTGNKDTQDRVDNGIYPFFVRSQIIEKINSYSFDGEAVITSGDGVGVGKIFHYMNGKFDYHQRVYNIHDFRNDVDGKFFFYFFSTHFYDRVMSMTAKSSVDSVRREMISNMQIPLPPTFAEQKAIAEALSDVDELIESLDKLIAKKKAIKQGVMQQLLTPPNKGGKRLPGFEGEWHNYKLKDIIEKVELGGNYPNSERISSSPLMKMGNLGRGNISLEKVEYISNNYTPVSTHILAYGDLLFNTRNTLELVGKVAVWRNEIPLAFFNSNILRFQFNKKVGSTFFMNYILNSSNLLNSLRSIATGTTSVAAIYTRDLFEINVTIPEPKEQKEIATIIEDFESEINNLQKIKNKYQQIKQGMMQELLTGKTRLI
jgi:type I restriction enzyme S subunit